MHKITFQFSRIVSSTLFCYFSPLADAVRTRTLSKRWKNLWSTLPYFDSLLCPTCNFFVEKLKAKQPFSDIDVRQEYFNFLESFMTNRLENITSVVSLGLHMDFPNIGALSPLMDQWVLELILNIFLFISKVLLCLNNSICTL